MGRVCSGCRDGVDFEIPFAMAFQPIVDVETGHAFAYEALVRGVDGAGASQILSRVTETNRYAFDQACRVKAIETAMAGGLMQSDARLSINFLPNAVYSPLACIQLTLATARRAGLPIDRLIFEFTENEQMGSPEHVSSIIDTYKQIGFTVAVDDFGAGHSGLDMFARFHPDEIKLDMELVRGIDQDRRRQAIVRAVVRMCEELKTLVIAEGIENAQEALALRELGVRYQQGYWYARPQLGVLPDISREAFAP
ncbi:EAL domain-containing protein [Sphingomonas nostoxanthinifaciens]|uniref:EAL domain-containing protein n=1 Tax=Sphingomonas nostoxanthinifaciens TaxID=2872652 RepID=UPI001CC1F9BE|nr:EAL domain-containing protein [Sphingomonas nostoxanthinifaciens]UAK26509.1 EAL domain-containing protein [Sphingomonas nostoxanthinifaciens]